MGGGAQAAGRGAGRVLPAWKTAQGSSDGQAPTAAAPSAQHVQGQFDDAEQGSGSDGEYDPAAPLEAEAAAEAELEAETRHAAGGKKKKKKRAKRKGTGARQREAARAKAGDPV